MKREAITRKGLSNFLLLSFMFFLLCLFVCLFVWLVVWLVGWLVVFCFTVFLFLFVLCFIDTNSVDALLSMSAEDREAYLETEGMPVQLQLFHTKAKELHNEFVIYFPFFPFLFFSLFVLLYPRFFANSCHHLFFFFWTFYFFSSSSSSFLPFSCFLF